MVLPTGIRHQNLKSTWAAAGWLALLVILAACGRPCAGPGTPTAGIVFVSERDGNGELYRVRADGTGLARLTDAPSLDADPAWSPDGTKIAFRSRRTTNSDIYVMDAASGGLCNLVEDAEGSQNDEFAPSWAPDGQKLAIITDRFNLEGCSPHQVALLPLEGGQDEITLLDAKLGNQRTVAWSPNGQFIAFNSQCGTRENDLYLWDLRAGKLKQLTRNAGINFQPAWSHNGRWLAFASKRNGQDFDIYRLDLETGELVDLTPNPADDEQPTWSPDDSQLAFVTDRDGNQEIYIMNTDGSDPHNLTQNPARDYAPSWSPAK